MLGSCELQYYKKVLHCKVRNEKRSYLEFSFDCHAVCFNSVKDQIKVELKETWLVV